jgi:hypothetical protein
MDWIQEVKITFSFQLQISLVFKKELHSGIKIFNSLPNSIIIHRNDRKKFKIELYRYLLYGSLYSVKEFFELSRNRIWWLSTFWVYCNNLLLCYVQCFLYLYLETFVLISVFLSAFLICFILFCLFVCFVLFVLYCVSCLCFFLFSLTNFMSNCW